MLSGLRKLWSKKLPEKNSSVFVLPKIPPMILEPWQLEERHPSHQGEHGERFLGYWRREESDSLPSPQDFVDLTWDPAERQTVVEHLQRGSVFESWMGFSPCRFCDCCNGGQCLTDGTFVWPEGFAHYLVEHAVRPPQEFVDHVRSMPLKLREELIRHQSAKQAILEAYKLVQDGRNCPNRGVVCHSEKSCMCLIRWPEGGSSGSSLCQRESKLFRDNLQTEKTIHKQNLALLLNRKLEKVGK